MNHTLLTGSALLLLATSLTAQWGQVVPTAAPAGRGGHGMTLDPTTGNVLVFGGDTLGFPVGASSETWSYDGTTWTLLAPAQSPPASVGVELVHDPVRGVFVTYGSVNTSFFGGASADRTWEFDGTTWTQVFPVHTPGGLGLYGMCFDAARSRIVLYGGVPDSFFPIAAGGTWEFDGTDWTAVTTAASPGPLERPAMCFDAVAGKTVLFGGIDPQTGGVDTTWLYDGVNWTAAAIAGTKPAARTGAKLAFDSVRGVCVLTGGSDPTTGNAIVDTWELDLAALAWTQMPTATTGRLNAGLAFVPSRRQVVQFGGWDFSSFTALADTREYGAKVRTFGTGCAGIAGVPALSATDAPRLAASWTLAIANLHPTVNVGIVVLSLTELTPTPLDGIGMLGCTAYVTPDALLAVTGAGGTATWSTALPAGVPFLGTDLFAQGLSLDPTANPAWLTASNALAGTVGR
jgi:hypothetical protein